MKEQLTLKELAAYLPYSVSTNTGVLTCSIIDRRDRNNTIQDIKMHLRPLSDLVIDENLIEDFVGLGNWCNAYDEYIDHWYPDASYAKQAPYVIFEYFLVNHYDVFGLIDRNLAIPITQTFNPYEQ